MDDVQAHTSEAEVGRLVAEWSRRSAAFRAPPSDTVTSVLRGVGRVAQALTTKGGLLLHRPGRGGGGAILLVLVDEACRRRGVATRLVQHLKDRSKTLTVDSPACTGEDAVRLWLRLGFMADQQLLSCTLSAKGAFVSGRSVQLSFTWAANQCLADEVVRLQFLSRAAERHPVLLPAYEAAMAAAESQLAAAKTNGIAGTAKTDDITGTAKTDGGVETTATVAARAATAPKTARLHGLVRFQERVWWVMGQTCDDEWRLRPAEKEKTLASGNDKYVLLDQEPRCADKRAVQAVHAKERSKKGMGNPQLLWWEVWPDCEAADPPLQVVLPKLQAPEPEAHQPEEHGSEEHEVPKTARLHGLVRFQERVWWVMGQTCDDEWRLRPAEKEKTLASGNDKYVLLDQEPRCADKRAVQAVHAKERSKKGMGNPQLLWWEVWPDCEAADPPLQVVLPKLQAPEPEAHQPEEHGSEEHEVPKTARLHGLVRFQERVWWVMGQTCDDEWRLRPAEKEKTLASGNDKYVLLDQEPRCADKRAVQAVHAKERSKKGMGNPQLLWWEVWPDCEAADPPLQVVLPKLQAPEPEAPDPEAPDSEATGAHQPETAAVLAQWTKEEPDRSVDDDVCGVNDVCAVNDAELIVHFQNAEGGGCLFRCWEHCVWHALTSVPALVQEVYRLADQEPERPLLQGLSRVFRLVWHAGQEDEAWKLVLHTQDPRDPAVMRAKGNPEVVVIPRCILRNATRSSRVECASPGASPGAKPGAKPSTYAGVFHEGRCHGPEELVHLLLEGLPPEWLLSYEEGGCPQSRRMLDPGRDEWARCCSSGGELLPEARVDQVPPMLCVLLSHQERHCPPPILRLGSSRHTMRVSAAIYRLDTFVQTKKAKRARPGNHFVVALARHGRFFLIDDFPTGAEAFDSIEDVSCALDERHAQDAQPVTVRMLFYAQEARAEEFSVAVAPPQFN